MDEGDRAALLDVLEEGRRRGLLGPGSLEPHIDHALGFAPVAGLPGAGPVGAAGTHDRDVVGLDLGTGGGIPGLVLALAIPDSRWVLLDSRTRSMSFVDWAASRLGPGVSNRVTTVCARGEDAGRDPEHRGRYGLVVARGFGPPAVTAECAAPLLASGGWLVVSEPPGSTGARWQPALELVGLRLDEIVQHGPGTYARLEQVKSCPATYPRRSGIPGKRPLFRVGNQRPDVSRETRRSP